MAFRLASVDLRLGTAVHGIARNGEDHLPRWGNSGRASAPRPRALRSLDYAITRQTGSHKRFTTQRGGEHHVTTRDHTPLRVGTLAAILPDVAEHFAVSREQLLDQLFG